MKPFETILDYKFRNPLLLTESLTHPSLAYEIQRPHFDNQRLEFLGDAVLQLVLTDHLYKMFPDSAEGDLTKMRARLVSKSALFAFAKTIELGSYMMLGKGEELSGGRDRASTLADAFEAMLGAVFLDGGFDVVKGVILRVAEDAILELSESPVENNPKGRLQEILQAIVPESPVYVINEESGPDHDKEFKVAVFWQGGQLAVGSGSNKKVAEASAAENALQAKLWEVSKL